MFIAESFQAISGMYDSADASVGEFVLLQKLPLTLIEFGTANCRYFRDAGRKHDSKALRSLRACFTLTTRCTRISRSRYNVMP